MPGGAEQSSAFDINDLGQVVGRSADNIADRAFLWQPNGPNQTTGTLVNLGDLPGGGNRSSASGINNEGQIVGSAQAASGLRAFLWQPTLPNATTGTFTDLGDLPGGEDYSIAHEINEIGQIVGSSWMTTGRHPTLWMPDASIPGTGVPVDLGSLPGGAEDGSEDAGAVSINSFGVVVGASLASTGYRAFLWRPDLPNGASGAMIDLGNLPSGDDYTLARAINNMDQVVGIDSLGDSRAFYWDSHYGMVDLNAYLDPVSGTGWVLNDARGINDFGQIVGYGLHNGMRRAFLLTPVVVPEPTAMTMVISALVFLVLQRFSPNLSF